MSRAGCLAAALAIPAVLGAATAAVVLLFRDEATPTKVGEAVTSFREQTETTPTGRSPVPEGVYVYATSGFEETDALTGVTHRYPPRSTITVTGDGCGVRMRWDVLHGRSTTWTYCLDAKGWELSSQDERHTFFGRTERTTYLCRDTPFRPLGDRPGPGFEVSCSTGAADEHGTGRVVRREELRVAGRPVAAVHLRKRTSFTGEIRGTARHDVWLDRKTGVPVKIVMVSDTTNDSPLGDVHYEERVALLLLSLRPRR